MRPRLRQKYRSDNVECCPGDFSSTEALMCYERTSLMNSVGENANKEIRDSLSAEFPMTSRCEVITFDAQKTLR